MQKQIYGYICKNKYKAIYKICKKVDKYIKLTVDALINEGDKIVLIKRKNPPYKGCFALPGGFVEYGESVEKAVEREALEETNLRVKVKDLVGVYSKPDRDPRGHTVGIAFLCSVISKEDKDKLKGGDDAESAEFFRIDEALEMKLAFDHKKMIKDMINLKQLKQKIKAKNNKK